METATRLKLAYASQFGGEQRGMPAIVDGDTEVTTLSFNLRELEFPDLRDQSESRICAAAGVPAVMVGLHVGVKSDIRATLKEYREYFTETTLSAKWRAYAAALTDQLASEFGEGIRLRFDTSQVRALQEQRRDEVAPLAEAFARGAVTVYEYRVRVLGLDDLGPAGDVLLVPSTVAPVAPAALRGAPVSGAPADGAPAPLPVGR